MAKYFKIIEIQSTFDCGECEGQVKTNLVEFPGECSPSFLPYGGSEVIVGYLKTNDLPGKPSPNILYSDDLLCTKFIIGDEILGGGTTSADGGIFEPHADNLFPSSLRDTDWFNDQGVEDQPTACEDPGEGGLFIVDLQENCDTYFDCVEGNSMASNTTDPQGQNYMMGDSVEVYGTGTDRTDGTVCYNEWKCVGTGQNKDCDDIISPDQDSPGSADLAECEANCNGDPHICTFFGEKYDM